jgi:hypothetical protein
MTKQEAGRLGGLAATRRHRWSSDGASAAGKRSAEARRCKGCGEVPARGREHRCKR